MADSFGLTTSAQVTQAQLDLASPTTLADVLRSVKLGSMLIPVKAVLSGITSTATPNITAASGTNSLTGATVALSGSPALPTGFTYPGTTSLAASGGTGNTLPPILSVRTLRDAHSNIVVDSGGTAVASTSTYPGTVLLSDDGTTLTFASAVTGFTIEYIPRAFTNLSSNYDDFNQQV